MNQIDFAVWAPSKEIWLQSWIAAGILDADGNAAPGYSDRIETTADTWPGIILKAGEPVAGWHCNVRVAGTLAAQFPSTEAAWQWAIATFGLTQQPADTVTGFPAGWRSPQGVTYCDPASFSSPSNVWA